MNAILLRKMTEKSYFHEGKFSGVPIFQLLQLNHKRYLRWCYYNMSNIDFVDDIKLKIGITKDFEIKKPGTDKEMFIKTNDFYESKMSFLAKKHFNKVKRINKEKADRLSGVESKSVMQARNQGKL